MSMLREPTTAELVAYICQVQPELDETSARRILTLDPCIREGLAQAFVEQRDRAESLLELHLTIEEIVA